MITTATLRDIFTRTIDKHGSDYFTDPQELGFLNDAIVSTYKQFLNPDGTSNKLPGRNAYWESSDKISTYLHPFLRTVSGDTDASGVLSSSGFATVLGTRELWGLTGFEGKTEDGAYGPIGWRSNAAGTCSRRG